MPYVTIFFLHCFLLFLFLFHSSTLFLYCCLFFLVIFFMFALCMCVPGAGMTQFSSSLVSIINKNTFSANFIQLAYFIWKIGRFVVFVFVLFLFYYMPTIIFGTVALSSTHTYNYLCIDLNS